MGLFGNGKCSIHKIEYSIDKNYMCQPYKFCKKCREEKRSIQDRLDRLEKQIVNK